MDTNNSTEADYISGPQTRFQDKSWKNFQHISRKDTIHPEHVTAISFTNPDYIMGGKADINLRLDLHIIFHLN